MITCLFRAAISWAGFLVSLAGCLVCVAQQLLQAGGDLGGGAGPYNDLHLCVHMDAENAFECFDLVDLHDRQVIDFQPDAGHAVADHADVRFSACKL